MFSFFICFSYETLLIVIFVSWKSDGTVRWICDGNQCKFVHIYSSFKNIISYSKNKRKDFNETLTRSRLCVTRIPSVTHRFCQYINRKFRYWFLQNLECARELPWHLFRYIEQWRSVCCVCLLSSLVCFLLFSFLRFH